MNELLKMRNIEIEKNVLGGCFQDNNLIDQLNEKLFTSSSNKEIIKVFKQLRKNGEQIDLLVFIDYMQKKEMPITITDITNIHDSFLSLSNINSHLDILKDLDLKRTVYNLVYSIDYTSNGVQILDGIVSQCEKMYSTVEQKEDNTRDYLISYLDDLRNKSVEPHIKTGFNSLDNDIVGFLNGQLITISAYTGIGKSVLTEQLILNMLKQDKKVVLFSLEMARKEIINKLVSNSCNIEFKKLYKNELSEEEIQIIESFGVNFLGNKEFEIYDNMSDIDTIVNTIKRDRLKGKLDIVFIDLINRVTDRHGDNKSRAEYLGRLTRKLKLLALQLSIPIIITCQINRLVEGRQDKRPTLADIKESNGIAEDSDLVIGLYRNRELEKHEVREELHNQGKLNYNSPNPNINPFAIELIILKGRNVSVDNYSFKWDGKYQRITNWSR